MTRSRYNTIFSFNQIMCRKISQIIIYSLNIYSMKTRVTWVFISIEFYIDSLLSLCFGENPQIVTYSAQPLCWSGWETSFPSTHRGVLRKDGAEIPWRWSLPECFTSSGGLQRPRLFLLIQWRRQRHLTWSATHDIELTNFTWSISVNIFEQTLWSHIRRRKRTKSIRKHQIIN